MLDFDILAWLIGILILVLLLSILWKQKRTLSHLIIFSVFWIYLLALVSVTIFPIPLPDAGMFLAKQKIIFVLSHINFMPFKYLSDPYVNPYIFFLEIFQNVLLTHYRKSHYEAGESGSIFQRWTSFLSCLSDC